MWGDAHPVLASGIWKMLINQVYFTYGSSSCLRLHVPPARTKSTFFLSFFFPIEMGRWIFNSLFSSFYFFCGVFAESGELYVKTVFRCPLVFRAWPFAIFISNRTWRTDESLLAERTGAGGGKTKRSNCLATSALALIAMNAS